MVSRKSVVLPRALLAALCALALVASMVVGSALSYADEAGAPAAEEVENTEASTDGVADNSNDGNDGFETAALPESENEAEETEGLPAGSDEADTSFAPTATSSTHTVTFGVNSPITATAGGTVSAPVLSDTVIEYNGESVAATFVGWYQTGLDENPVGGSYASYEKKDSGTKSIYAAEGRGIAANRAEFPIYPASSSITVDGDMTFWAMYSVPVCLVGFGYTFDGVYANGFLVGVVKGKTILSNPGVQSEIAYITADGYILDSWVYDKKPFDPNTPINSDAPIDDYGFPLMVTAHFVTPTKEIPVEGTTGVTASGNLVGANVPTGAEVVLSAAAVTSGAVFDDLNELLGESRFGDVIEFSLKVNGEEIHDGFGKILLSFPVGSEWNGYYFTVYHRHDDGTITSEAVIARNGFINITVSDLSSFALVRGENSEAGEGDDDEGDENETGETASALPQTGDNLALMLFGVVSAFSACALFAVSFLRVRQRKS
jgi:hypothetical protein